MKLLIFGASGLTGRELVTQALERNHQVTAFVRSPSKLAMKHPNLVVTQGEITEPAHVEAAVRGQGSVLCALGASGIFSRTPALTQGLRNIVGTMEHSGVQRLVYESALGAGDSRQDAGLFTRYLVIPFVLRNPYADHDEDEATLRASRLEWVVVRPAVLTKGVRRERYRAGVHLKDRFPFGLVSRADVAHFRLEQTRLDAFVRQGVNLRY